MSAETGMERIAAAFAQTGAEQRAALMPYLTLGYPSLERSLELVQAAAQNGADLIELGVPFSDPLADGPVIQQATHLALQRGTTAARCLEAVRALRRRGIKQPLILMGYYNPILAYGEAAFCRRCAEVGVNGLIVPDLPPEEGVALEEQCRRRGLALIYLLAPTSPPDRQRLIAERSQGFVYLVTVTGTTGPREHLPPDLADFVSQVREATDKPLAVGFGIAAPEQARQAAAIADGVIVGSALVRRAEARAGREQIAALVSALRQAVERGA